MEDGAGYVFCFVQDCSCGLRSLAWLNTSDIIVAQCMW